MSDLQHQIALAVVQFLGFAGTIAVSITLSGIAGALVVVPAIVLAVGVAMDN